MFSTSPEVTFPVSLTIDVPLIDDCFITLVDFSVLSKDVDSAMTLDSPGAVVSHMLINVVVYYNSPADVICSTLPDAVTPFGG